MKRQTNLERRKDREYFIKAHARKIGEFIAMGEATIITQAAGGLINTGRANIKWRQVAGLKAFVNVDVRHALAYGKTTVWDDIWYTLRRDYDRLYPEKMEFGPVPRQFINIDTTQDVAMLGDKKIGDVVCRRHEGPANARCQNCTDVPDTRERDMMFFAYKAGCIHGTNHGTTVGMTAYFDNWYERVLTINRNYATPPKE